MREHPLVGQSPTYLHLPITHNEELAGRQYELHHTQAGVRLAGLKSARNRDLKCLITCTVYQAGCQQ
jgi:hypothetical protein